jgi:RNA polymerase sigma-70 factor (ECF subfamily)
MEGGFQPARARPDTRLPRSRPASLAGLEGLLQELFERSGGERWGLSAGDFSAILAEVAEKYPPAGNGPGPARELLAGLRVEDLALARACARGHEVAWEVFLTRYREKLFDSARAIAKDDAHARELADSLYGELYGTEAREGGRASKLNSYMGRGSLEGWLRAVLAQAWVDRYRRQRRLVSLEEKDEAGMQFPALEAEASVAADPRLEAATSEALRALSAEDRFVLAAYFLDGRTLAQIARLLGMHESSISRRVEKITAGLRKHIRAGMVSRGMSRRQAEEALQADVRDLAIDVRKSLAQESAAGSFSQQGPGSPSGAPGKAGVRHGGTS